MRIWGALAGALFLPAVGLAVGLAPAWLESRNVATTLTRTLDCARAGLDWASAPGCQAYGWHPALALAALAAAALGLALIVIFRLASLLTGSNRTLLALVFPPLAALGVIAAALIAVSQLGVLAAAVWLGEQLFIGRAHVGIVAVIAVFAALAAFAVLRNGLKMFGRAEAFVIGIPLGRYDQPQLSLLIRDVAATLKAKEPKNIVVGLDPTFFATAAAVRTPFSKGALRGETLFLSLPLMRLLSTGELKAVIGHELGHFAGRDVQYSKWFAPVYRGLEQTNQALETNSNFIGRILTAPVRAIVRYLIAVFAHAERKVSRERELRADEHGVAASSPQDLAYSLLKVSITGGLWSHEIDELHNRIRRGLISRNLSRNFIERIRYDIDRQKIAPRLELSLDDHIPHPTDTHPPTRDRIASAGLDPKSLVKKDDVLERFFAVEPSTAVLDDMQGLEEALTGVFHHWVISSGSAVPPESEEFHEIFLKMVSDYLAIMVTADERVMDAEIEVAEREAANYEPAFDRTYFRERCRHKEDLPGLEQITAFANKVLTTKGAERLRAILLKIASADGELHEAEQQIVDYLDANLKGEDAID